MKCLTEGDTYQVNWGNRNYTDTNHRQIPIKKKFSRGTGQETKIFDVEEKKGEKRTKKCIYQSRGKSPNLRTWFGKEGSQVAAN